MNRLLIIALILLCHSPLFATTVIVKTGDGGNFFSPVSFTINPGDTVKWVWVAGHHNTSSYSIPKGASLWYSNLDAATSEYYFVPTVSGLYRYTCTHHSGMDGSIFVTGCSFPERPTLSISWKSNPCLGGVKAVLRTKSQAGANYQWLNGGTLISGATADSLSISASGSYKVVVNRCGEDSLSDPYFVPAYPLPAASFSNSSSGLIFSFTNTTTPKSGYSFSWNFGDGAAEVNEVHPLHTYLSEGLYTVRLLVRDSAGLCKDSTLRPLNAALNMESSAYNRETRIFPNPATTEVNISAPSVCRLEVTNLFGQTLMRGASYQSEHRLNTQSLAPGIYLLCLYKGDGSKFVHRVWIQ